MRENITDWETEWAESLAFHLLYLHFINILLTNVSSKDGLDGIKYYRMNKDSRPTFLEEKVDLLVVFLLILPICTILR